MEKHIEMNVALVQEANQQLNLYSCLLQKEFCGDLTVGERKLKQSLEVAIRARQDYLDIYWSLSRESLKDGPDTASDNGDGTNPGDEESV